MPKELKLKAAFFLLCVFLLCGLWVNSKSLLAQSQCKDIGENCSTAADCCNSYVCSGEGKCCIGINNPCTQHTQCCIGGCDFINGTCADCLPDGRSCNANSQCCSGRCISGKCETNCLSNGSSCDYFADCCSGNCMDGICKNLLNDGEACTNSEQCKSRICWEGSCKSCLPDGSSCSNKDDCCSFRCIGGKCTSSCKSSGKSCFSPEECCNFICTNNICSGTCSGNGVWCYSNAECCSNNCFNNRCREGYNPSTLGCPNVGLRCRERGGVDVLWDGRGTGADLYQILRDGIWIANCYSACKLDAWEALLRGFDFLYEDVNASCGVSYFYSVNTSSATGESNFCNQNLPITCPCDSSTPTPTSTSGPAWFQSRDGDVHSGGRIRSRVPAGEYFSLDGVGGFPGVISYEGLSANFSPGGVSSKGWLAKSEAKRRNYEFFYALLGQPRLISPPLDKKIRNVDLSDGMIKAYEGDIETGSTWQVETKKIVILTTGSFLIKHKIEVEEGGSLVVIAKGDINVDGGLGGTNNQIHGFFIADGAFSSGSGNKRLIVKGGVIANNFNLERDLADNSDTPAEKFVYRPDMFLNLHPSLWLRYHLWEELAP